MKIHDKLPFHMQEHSDGTLTVHFFDTMEQLERTVKIDDLLVVAALRSSIRYGAEQAQEKMRLSLGIIGE